MAWLLHGKRWLGALALALCVTLGVPGAQAAPATDAHGAPLGRLPASVRPLRYRLALRIDPDAAGFSGHVEIDVELDRAADGVWLHGRNLQVTAVAARIGGEAGQLARYRQVDESGVARLDFGRTVPAGPVTLAFDYRAPFGHALEGLYRVSENGKHYAVTQFEATSARLAFPCFDEPRFKVPFDITLQVPDGAVAVTNTPKLAEEPAKDGFVRIRFAPTPPLPTYLIAFAVGPWDEREGETMAPTALRERAVPLRAFAAAGKGDQLDYALGRTGAIVNGLEDYLGVAYPFRKLDLVAVPDFAAGAMENAGAITYREQLLLFGDDASVLRKQSFAAVDAHELSHQWFGDLVTPTWWDDIWLNEAFATWMSAKVMGRLEPDQGYGLRQLESSLEVMKQDALGSARRIRQPVESPEEIGSAFDDITYEKGAAVLSMLERFVGADHFRQGIHGYLQAHQYANADAAAFVQAIAATRPDLPKGQVKDAFFSFLDQPGTPLVALDWSCRAAGKTRISVTQSRYLPVGSQADANRQWRLPLCLAFGDDDERSEHCELVQAQKSTFELDTPCPAWVMPNAAGAGYYRFALSLPHWKALLSASNLIDREQLAVAANLSGAFRAADINVGQYLAMLPGLLDSDSVEVVTAPLDDLKWIHDRLVQGASRRRLDEILADYYSDIAVRVPPDARPAERTEVQLQMAMARLYALVIGTSAWRDSLARQAADYVEARGSDKTPETAGSLPASLREIAFTVAVEERGKRFAGRLLALLGGTNDAQLRQDILRAVSRGGDPGVLERLRELALTDAVRDNEVDDILEPQMDDADSRGAAWQWLLAHFDAVAARRPYWFRGSVVAYGRYFCNAERAEEIEHTLAGEVRTMGSGPRSLAETVERIHLCQALVDAQRDSTNRVLGGGP